MADHPTAAAATLTDENAELLFLATRETEAEAEEAVVAAYTADVVGWSKETPEEARASVLADIAEGNLLLSTTKAARVV